jgi:hypothetical protein
LISENTEQSTPALMESRTMLLMAIEALPALLQP